MWILQTVEPDAESVTFRIRSGSIKTVGRAPRADFVVDAPLVSRLHCQLTAMDDTLQVEDLKSTNGTFVNDQRIERASLTNGDRLRVGRVEMKVEQATS
jgi:pSer/pThr/pTyr-binding forkhead associated (FHA) protein